MDFYQVISIIAIIALGIIMFLAFKNAADSAKINSKSIK